MTLLGVDCKIINKLLTVTS